MFYVYTPQGRTFAGPMEKLRRVEKTTKTEKSATQNNTESEQMVHRDDSINPTYELNTRAVSEYQDMLKQNSQKEVVYHAYQIMSHPVLSIQGDSTLEEAFKQFESCSYQVLPVLNGGMLIATLSRKELYAALLKTPPSQHAILVRDIIPDTEKNVISADPVTDVRRIAKVLVDHQLDALPVTENSHKVVGIVSRTDILACVTADPPLSLWC